MELIRSHMSCEISTKDLGDHAKEHNTPRTKAKEIKDYGYSKENTLYPTSSLTI